MSAEICRSYEVDRARWRAGGPGHDERQAVGADVRREPFPRRGHRARLGVGKLLSFTVVNFRA